MSTCMHVCVFLFNHYYTATILLHNFCDLPFEIQKNHYTIHYELPDHLAGLELYIIILPDLALLLHNTERQIQFSYDNIHTLMHILTSIHM